MIIGHFNGQLMTRQQPMKMAAAEALYNTAKPAGFSLFAVAPFEQHPSRTSFDITVPHTLSLLATNTLERSGQGHQPAPGRRRGQVRARATTSRSSA